MCYHVSTPSGEKLKENIPFKVDIQPYDVRFHASGFTYPKLPVQTMDEPHLIKGVSWGLIPTWTKPGTDLGKLRTMTLNAMSETIYEKPSFRSSAGKKRCLIWVDGFFEWRWEDEGGKRKTPHYIYLPDHRPFALGGLYADWRDDSGELIRTCSIVTTEANELMATIHNNKKRMPLVLGQDAWDTWLNDKLPKPEIDAIMRPYHDGQLVAHEISNLLSQRGVDTNVAAVQQEFRQSLF